jgi:hypothetical protein
MPRKASAESTKRKQNKVDEPTSAADERIEEHAIHVQGRKKKKVASDVENTEESTLSTDEVGSKKKKATVVPIDWDSPAALMVGARVQHWWEGDESWYCGRIVKFRPVTGEHLVRYDIDGEELWLDIIKEPMLYCAQVRDTHKTILTTAKSQFSIYIYRLDCMGSGERLSIMALPRVEMD